MKLNSTFIWVFTVVAASIGLFVYMVRQDQTATLDTRITLSHYADEAALAEDIRAQAKELMAANHIWLGVEPNRMEQIDFVITLKQRLEKERPFAHVIVDSELQLKPETVKKLAAGDVVPLKENLYEVGEKLAQLEKNGISYLVVTAAIYSTSTLPRNPLDVLKTQFALNPATLSLAYFPVTAENEKNMVFPCRTADDHTGTAPWGCLVVNKSRLLRKKIRADKNEPWVGYMESSSPRDYVLVIHKNE